MSFKNLVFDVTKDAPSAEDIGNELKRLKVLKKHIDLKAKLRRIILTLSQFFLIVFWVIPFLTVIIDGGNIFVNWSSYVRLPEETIAVITGLSLFGLIISKIGRKDPAEINQDLLSLSAMSTEEDSNACIKFSKLAKENLTVMTYLNALKREPVWAEYTAAKKWVKEKAGNAAKQADTESMNYEEESAKRKEAVIKKKAKEAFNEILINREKA